MDTLAEIQERHSAVRELERKLLELQQVRNKFYACCPVSTFPKSGAMQSQTLRRKVLFCQPYNSKYNFPLSWVSVSHRKERLHNITYTECG